MTAPLKDSSPINIKILLGAHDFNMVDDVVKAAKDCNLLFLEFISTKSAKDKFTRFANDLTRSDRFNPELFNREYIVNLQDAYFQILWKLRKRDMYVEFVDRTLTDDEEEERKKDYDTVPDDIFEKVIKTGDFNQFYDQVDKNVEAKAKIIRSRDLLVARQVARKIKEFQKSHPDQRVQAVLVQGGVHNSRPHIQKLLPEAQIVIAHYNELTNKSIFLLPNTQMTASKLKYPHRKISDAEADRTLLEFLEIGIHSLEHQEFASRPRTSTISTEFRKDEIFKFTVKNQKKLENLSPQQLHDLVTQKISEFKAAIEKYDSTH